MISLEKYILEMNHKACRMPYTVQQIYLAHNIRNSTAVFYRRKSAMNVMIGMVITDNTVVKEKISDA